MIYFITYWAISMIFTMFILKPSIIEFTYSHINSYDIKDMKIIIWVFAFVIISFISPIAFTRYLYIKIKNLL